MRVISTSPTLRLRTVLSGSQCTKFGSREVKGLDTKLQMGVTKD